MVLAEYRFDPKILKWSCRALKGRDSVLIWFQLTQIYVNIYNTKYNTNNSVSKFEMKLHFPTVMNKTKTIDYLLNKSYNKCWFSKIL